MRLGLCCSLAEAPVAVAAGFDYVELPANRTLGDEAFDPARLQGLPVEAMNQFFPDGVRLFDPGATPYQEYTERTVARAAAAGVRRIVLGSGAARRAPDEMDPIARERRFVQIATEIARIGNRHHVTIAPEPLNVRETNVGNDLALLAEELLEAGVGYTADAYHVLVDIDRPEEIDWTEQLPHPPAHVHLADALRRPPSPDDPVIRAFVRRLRELGYDGRVSLECRWGDLDDELVPALEAVRTILAEEG